MKTKSNLCFKALFAIAIFFALTFTNTVYATSGNSGNSNKHTYKKHGHKKHKKKHYKKYPKKHKPNKPDSIPLDGGLSILLAGAAVLGVKKLRQNKNGKI